MITSSSDKPNAHSVSTSILELIKKSFTSNLELIKKSFTRVFG